MYNNTDMSDYSDICLKIITFTEGCEPKIHLDHGYAPLLPDTNPLDYFINAEEAFVLFMKSGNVVQLWKRTGNGSVIAASVAIRVGSKIYGRSVVKLLRECVDTPQIADVVALFRECEIFDNVMWFPCRIERNENILNQILQEPELPRAMRSYTSTASLVELIDARLDGGDAEVETLILAAATAVAAVDETELPRLRAAKRPDFEVNATAASKPEPKPSLKSYYFDDEPEEYEEPVLQETKSRKRGSKWVTAALFVVALAIGYAVVRYLPDLLPSSTSYDNIEATNVSELPQNQMIAAVADTVTDTVATADTAAVITDSVAAATIADTAAQPAAAQSEPTETVDIEYLNSNKVWDRSMLKSEKYRAFFDLFAQGDLYEIANADYFAVEGQCTNTRAKKVADLIWQAYKTPTHQSNRRELRKLKGSDRIDLQKLINTLALYRDRNPNKSPRPKR